MKLNGPYFMHGIHSFSNSELIAFQTSLLQWYRACKRDLPWRSVENSTNRTQKAYSVLVSEIMLQQTQVITVQKYYEKWMARWPSVQQLANASLEEVNEMWAGLGYYSRGRRLYEVAQKVSNELNGEFPENAAALQKHLVGVGRYTAGAVASIAWAEPVAAVDGNAIRVLARQRLIGADTSRQAVVKQIWKIAEDLIDINNPGDFNQGMMELGATICTPKNPLCSKCPVQSSCLAFKHVTIDKIPDIESIPECLLCSSDELDQSIGVMNYPKKFKKLVARRQHNAVCIIFRDSKFFIVKRPPSGLLANLWEFPNKEIQKCSIKKEWNTLLQSLVQVCKLEESHLSDHTFVGEVCHLFTHIKQTYSVHSVVLEGTGQLEAAASYQGAQWVKPDKLSEIAMSSGMKKVFNLYNSFSIKEHKPKRIAEVIPVPRYKKSKHIDAERT